MMRAPGEYVSRDEAIALMRDGECPMCGKKGWRSVALHCSLAHDLDKRQLRDLYAIPVSYTHLTLPTTERV